MNRRHIEPIARDVVAVSAWMVLGLVIASGVTSIDAIGSWLASSPEGSLPALLSSALIALGGAAMLILWASAVLHAFVDVRRTGVPRLLLIGMLIVFNFVGGFFYYFLYLVWRKPTEF